MIRTSMLVLPLLAACVPFQDDDGRPRDSGRPQPSNTVEFGGNVMAPAGTEIPAPAVDVVLVSTPWSDPGNTFGDVFSTTEAQGLAAGGEAPFTFDLPAEPEDQWLETIDPATDMRLAMLQLGAYVDRNDNGMPDEGDQFVGAGESYLAYATGTIRTDLEAMGMREGWNLVTWPVGETASTAIEPIQDGYADYEIPGNLLAMQRPDLGGTIVPNLGMTARVDLYAISTEPAPADPTLTSVDVISEADTAVFVFPAPLPAPPPDHITDVAADTHPGIKAARYMAVAYEDVDADGKWTPATEDGLASSATAGPDSRMLVFVVPTSFTAARYAAEEEVMPMGWSLYSMPETGPGVVVPWESGLVLDAVSGP